MRVPGIGRTIEQSGPLIISEHMDALAEFARERAALPPLTHRRADLAATHSKFRPSNSGISYANSDSVMLRSFPIKWPGLTGRRRDRVPTSSKHFTTASTYYIKRN